MIESADEFVQLRTSEERSEYLRASQESADETVWRDVMSRFPEMMEWVAHNKTISETIIRELHEKGDARTRIVLARKRSTPADLLTSLATDKSDSIRLAVATHPKAPLGALQVLAADPWQEVRKAAEARLRSLGRASS